VRPLRGGSSDAERVAAVLRLFERIEKGQCKTLGDSLALLFGWDANRIFLAIHRAIDKGWIAPNELRKAEQKRPAPKPRKAPSRSRSSRTAGAA
jgi:hypothetical protein